MHDHWPENREGWATYGLDTAMMDHTRTSVLAQSSTCQVAALAANRHQIWTKERDVS